MTDQDKDNDRPEREATVRFHPKSPDASADRIRELAGRIALTGPAPLRKFLDE
jgi:hypothetical protein